MWHDPERPFLMTRAALRRYVEEGDWVLLFNALTLYSDVEKRRGDLFYADPLAVFDRCKRQYSRFVTLLHDYPLYEFTIMVRR